jgi:hypothetical protein
MGRRSRQARSLRLAKSRNPNIIDTPQRGKVLAQSFGALSWVWAMEARAGNHDELAAALYSQDARIHLGVGSSRPYAHAAEQ